MDTAILAKGRQDAPLVQNTICIVYECCCCCYDRHGDIGQRQVRRTFVTEHRIQNTESALSMNVVVVVIDTGILAKGR